MDIITKLKNIFNTNYDKTNYMVPSHGYRPDRSNDNNFYIGGYSIDSILNKIAVDCSAIEIRHIKTKNKTMIDYIPNSFIDKLFNYRANVDQTGNAFLIDLYYTLFTTGCVAVVPIQYETKLNVVSLKEEIINISEIRLATIKTWMPETITVKIFNSKTQDFEEKTVPKDICLIVENPFFSTMNANSSTVSRIRSKLQMLDKIDEQSSSGKLDMIIQLPYVVRGEKRISQAEDRRKNIEAQLTGSKYGIAYIDGTEKVIQLNRSVENNLLTQIQFLTDKLLEEIGISKEILNGTANEDTVSAYERKILAPVIKALVMEINTKWISFSKYNDGERVDMFRDPFGLLTAKTMGEFVDTLLRHEVVSPNEVRAELGYKPSDDPKADELRNRTIKQEPSNINGREESINEHL